MLSALLNLLLLLDHLLRGWLGNLFLDRLKDGLLKLLKQRHDLLLDWRHRRLSTGRGRSGRLRAGCSRRSSRRCAGLRGLAGRRSAGRRRLNRKFEILVRAGEPSGLFEQADHALDANRLKYFRMRADDPDGVEHRLRRLLVGLRFIVPAGARELIKFQPVLAALDEDFVLRSSGDFKTKVAQYFLNVWDVG